MKLLSAPLLVRGLALLAWLLAGPRGAAGAQPAGAVDALTATLRSVDVEARRVEVLTAVGHAVRVVTLHVEPDCVIRVDGAPASLAALRPGRIVRIDYRPAGAGAKPPGAARAIETLAKPPSSGAGP